MEKTPKSLRLHIGIFGRSNVGKSSFLNLVAGQDVAITSPIAGTTTDVVEKTMELLPLGPVVFLDTAGVDDASVLGSLRIRKTKNIFERAEVIILIVEADMWTEYEEYIIAEAQKRKIPVITVINKIDRTVPADSFIHRAAEKSRHVLCVSSIDKSKRDSYVAELKKKLIDVCPQDFLDPHALAGDLLPQGGVAVFIVPIDLEAPRGRLILPQVQAIRDILDYDSAVMVVKESEYAGILKKLKTPPDLVVCDSQVVDKMVAETPEGVCCTTFSILFARFKGDLSEFVRGAKAIDSLQPHDKVLIAESCSHHAIEDDIGRIKIPRWLQEYTKFPVAIDICSGKDFPDNLADYKLIIHCGACMMNRKEIVSRLHRAQSHRVAITNYGVCIAFLHGVLDRVLGPFPSAFDVLKKERIVEGECV